MEQWRIVESTQGLRMEPSELRAIGEEGVTWAHLLYGKLGSVEVGIFYFPSRFDTAADKLIIEELRTFGRNTGESISVNIWDPPAGRQRRWMTRYSQREIPQEGQRFSR